MTSRSPSCPTAWSAPAASSARLLTCEVVIGEALARALPEIDALSRAVRAPATAYGAWLRARTADALAADADVWAVLVRDAGGALRAASVLVDETEPPVAPVPAAPGRTVLAAGGEGYRAWMPAADADAADALGLALSAAAADRAPWRALELGPLPDDPLVRRTAAALAAEVVECAPVPQVRRGPEATADDPLAGVLSHGTRKTLRKSRNRLATDGLDHVVAFTDDLAAVAAVLPRMAGAYRERDREHGLPSLLDDESGQTAWVRRIAALHAAGVLELATLTVDGDLVAYVLGLLDGERYGVLEGRFASAWSRYAPGRLLEAAVMARVLGDPALTALDWMTSVASETLLAVTDTEPAVLLRRPPLG